ncbi:MAG: proprotein convertase P-domain-containing protein, partial [Planctomycetota bacterium]|nr:proprotein convertase P-domain-containing protein [Planctomycetota bacterium]
MRARRQSQQRLELLEPRLVLEGPGIADYGPITPAGFGTVPQIYTGADAVTASSLTSGSDSRQIDVGWSRWIVQLNAAASQHLDSAAAVERLLDTAAVDFQVVRGLGLPGQVLVLTLGDDEARAADSLRNNPDVAYFEPDSRAEALAVPNDPRYSEQFGLDKIQAPAAWEITQSQAAPVVAVLDSGVDYTHPDLYRQVWINQGEIPSEIKAALFDADHDGAYTFADLNDPANRNYVSDLNQNGYIDAGDLLHDSRWVNGINEDGNRADALGPEFVDDLVGWDFVNNDNDPFDDNGHGTHVAGILAAESNNGVGVAGVAGQTSILPLKFLGVNNDGYIADAIAATNYLRLMRNLWLTQPDRGITDRGINVQVVNNSWVSKEGFSQGLRDAIAVAGAQQILFVAGAGNGNAFRRGNNNDQAPVYPASYDLPNVISVAATDRDDHLVPYFNFGPISVDLAAPGLDILSTTVGGGYGLRSGTSMATPFVSGAAALVFAQLPDDATVVEVRQALLGGVDPLPMASDRGLIASGGRLNAARSLQLDLYAPRARLVSGSESVEVAGGTRQDIAVRFDDNLAVDVSSLGSADLLVRRSGGGATFPVTFVDVVPTASTPTLTARYRLTPPGGSWDYQDNGTYEIYLQPGEVTDVSVPANAANSGLLGSFVVDVLDLGQFRVNSFEDTVDENPGNAASLDANGKSTLRAAVMEANALPGPNTIFLPAGDFHLSRAGAEEDLAATGDLDIRDDLTLIGAGARPALEPQYVDIGDAIVAIPWREGLSLVVGSPALRQSQTATDLCLELPSLGLAVPAGSELVDGGILRISNGTQAVIYEFDADGTVQGGHYPLRFASSDAASAVAARIVAAVEDTFFGVPVPPRANGDRIAFWGQDWIVDASGSGLLSQTGMGQALADGESFSLTYGERTVRFEFDRDGQVLLGNEPIVVAATASVAEVGDRVVQAIRAAGDRLLGNTVIDGQQIDRVLDVFPGVRLTLQNVVVTGGQTLAEGGGIRNQNGELSILGSLLAGNTARDGGGVASWGTLSMADSRVTNNVATASGGGLYNQGIAVLNSILIDRNAAWKGGGVLNGGQLAVESSTVAANQATFGGGGIVLDGAPGLTTLQLRNSTVSGNHTEGNHGGGLLMLAGEAELIHGTIFGNSTVFDGISFGTGGGIYVESGVTVLVGNTIVASNTVQLDGYGYPADVAGGFISLGNNLIGFGSGAVGFADGLENDQVGVFYPPLDPRLGPLADNGGPVPTHEPLLGSPAIDRANPRYAPSVDQRGILRPQDGDGDGDLWPDIGAVELYYGSLRGTKFNDLNGNGQRDVGEPGLANWTIFLDLDGDGVVDSGEPQTRTLADDPQTPDTDETGSYAFSGLAPGPYRAVEISPAGWLQTTPTLAFPVSDQSATGLDPQSAVVADWNRDGAQDFLVATARGGLPTTVNSTDVPVVIRDTATVVSHSSVSGFVGAIADLDVGLRVTGGGAGELRVYLTSPAGTRLLLLRGTGQFPDTTLDDAAEAALVDQGGLFVGRFHPETPLSAFNDEDPNGVWTLELTATVPESLRTLDGWTLWLTPVPIFVAPDVPLPTVDGQTVTSQLTVADFAGTLADVDVRLDITHFRDTDLAVYLTSPAGTRICLFSWLGGNGGNFRNTRLDDEADLAADEGFSPFTGRFRPAQALSVFDGQDPHGTWTLEIYDDSSNACTGTLEDWALILTPAISFASTQVPLETVGAAATTSTLTLAGLSGMVFDLDVTVDITDPSPAGLWAHLISPSGTRVTLFSNLDGSGSDLRQTTLDDEAPGWIGNAIAPFTGRFQPQGLLAAFDGQDPNGVWTLELFDTGTGPAGKLENWSLAVTSAPRTPGLSVAATQVPVPILDFQPISSTLTVNAFTGVLFDVDVVVDITHTWDADLQASLTSPSGTCVELFNRVGWSGDNFQGTTLDDGAAIGIGDGQAPFIGHFRPQQPLSSFAGEDPNGVWILSLLDSAFADQGVLQSWSLVLTPLPLLPPPISVASSEVPLDVVRAATLISSLDLTGFSGSVQDLDVVLDVAHPSTQDLIVFLTSPTGTRVELFGEIGGHGANFRQTRLDDEAALPIAAGAAPFTGRFRPGQALSAFDGQDPNGIWTLEIVDTYPAQRGILEGWGLSLTFPSPAVAHDSSAPPLEVMAPTTVTSTLVVENFVGQLSDLDLTFDLRHPADGQLSGYLTSPWGTRVELFRDVGGSGADFRQTTLDDEATSSLVTGSALFTGRFRPAGLLSAYDNQSPNGVWTLELTDTHPIKPGVLERWSLTLAPQATALAATTVNASRVPVATVDAVATSS